MIFVRADGSYKSQEEITSRKCEAVEWNMEGKWPSPLWRVVLLSSASHGRCVVYSMLYLSKGSLCVLCLCINKPCGCCSNSVTPISVNLCFRLWPRIGQSLIAVLTETEDGQHVSPLLPPQRMSFVQRGELTERGERVWASHIQASAIILCLHTSHFC